MIWVDKFKQHSNLRKNIRKARFHVAEKFLKIAAPHYHNIIRRHANVSTVPRPFTTHLKNLFKDRPLTGVEVGVYRGENAKNILQQLNMEKLYLVDPWACYEGFGVDGAGEYANKNEIEKVYNNVKTAFAGHGNVEIIRDFSQTASARFDENSLDFVYIDGNHRYEHVYRDIKSWHLKVKQGGVVGGHDVLNIIDVITAVSDWCVENKQKFVISPPDWYLTKQE